MQIVWISCSVLSSVTDNVPQNLPASTGNCMFRSLINVFVIILRHRES